MSTEIALDSTEFDSIWDLAKAMNLESTWKDRQITYEEVISEVSQKILNLFDSLKPGTRAYEQMAEYLVRLGTPPEEHPLFGKEIDYLVLTPSGVGIAGVGFFRSVCKQAKHAGHKISHAWKEHKTEILLGVAIVAVIVAVAVVAACSGGAAAGATAAAGCAVLDSLCNHDSNEDRRFGGPGQSFSAENLAPEGKLSEISPAGNGQFDSPFRGKYVSLEEDEGRILDGSRAWNAPFQGTANLYPEQSSGVGLSSLEFPKLPQNSWYDPLKMPYENARTFAEGMNGPCALNPPLHQGVQQPAQDLALLSKVFNLFNAAENVAPKELASGPFSSTSNRPLTEGERVDAYERRRLAYLQAIEALATGQEIEVGPGARSVDPCLLPSHDNTPLDQPSFIDRSINTIKPYYNQISEMIQQGRSLAQEMMQSFGTSSESSEPHFNAQALEAVNKAETFLDTSKLLPTLGTRQPHLRFMGGNGIATTLDGAMSHQNYIKSFVPGDLGVDWIYNKTRTPLVDIAEALVLCYHGFSPKTSELMKGEWTAFHEANKNNPHAKILHFCHSKGAIDTYNALAASRPEIRDRVIVVAIAPAKVVPKSACFRSFNYASKNDVVPYGELLSAGMFDTGEFGMSSQMKMTLEHREELILLDPHSDATGIDHDFQSPTFKERIGMIIRDHLECNGEYK